MSRLTNPISFSIPISASLRASPRVHLRHLSSFTSRLFKLPPPPQPPSTKHHDLPSFLAHAARNSLPSTTPTYIGTHYEYTVQSTLRAFSFHLHRIGGRSDSGIDLFGTWHLPGHEHPLRVCVQCKALKTKLSPNLVRELDGTVRRHAGWRTGQQMGVLVSTREATKGVRETLGRSEHPVLWMMVDYEGVLRQVLWNEKVEALGAVGQLGAEMRYMGDVDGVRKEAVLTWDGEEMECMDSLEERMERLEEQWMQVWGLDGDGDIERGYTKMDVLEAIERLFPAEKPLLYGKERCCSLSEEEKAKVKEFVEASRRRGRTTSVL